MIVAKFHEEIPTAVRTVGYRRVYMNVYVASVRAYQNVDPRRFADYLESSKNLFGARCRGVWVSHDVWGVFWLLADTINWQLETSTLLIQRVFKNAAEGGWVEMGRLC